MATSAQLRKQILQGSWDAALAALYGADPAVLQRQRGRYAAALEQFELYFGPGRQVQVYSAPGRESWAATTRIIRGATALRRRSRWIWWQWLPAIRMAMSG